MAYRIHVDGVTPEVVQSVDAALALATGSEVSVLSAYTAFFELVM